MTVPTVTKIGYAAGVIASFIAGAVVALTSGRAEHKEAPLSVAPSTLSAPALTTADLVGVRDELRQLRIDTSKDIADVREDVRALRKEVHEARR